MFKCKECGAEYDIKPDYCECGNDIFELVDNFDEEIEEFDKFEKREILEIPKIDFISPIIFTICIILSIVILFFIGNPQKTEKTSQKTAVEDIKEIPALDTFWDNTPKKPSQQIIVEEQKPEPMKILQEITEKIIPQPTKKPETPKPVAVKVQSKSQPAKTLQTQPKTPVKTTTKSQPQTLVQKTVDPNISSLTRRVQTNAQNSVNKQQQSNTAKIQTTTTVTQQKPVQQQTQTPQTTVKTQQPQTVVQNPQQNTKPVVQTPQIQKATAQEFSNYKISLRNTIGRRIDFTKVVGDGSCSLSFKVNSSGKLTNRAFTQQSSNITLNDAVYSAMLATPSFNTPPNGYSDRTYRLTVKFYNGNFDITLN